MRMIDFTNYSIIDNVEDYKTITINLLLSNEMELRLDEFDIALNSQLEKQLANIKTEENKDSVFFLIKTDLNRKDRELMRDFLLGRFVSYIVLNDIPEDREKRLGLPEGIKDVNLMNMALMDLVNKYVPTLSVLNIGITTRSGKNIDKIMED